MNLGFLGKGNASRPARARRADRGRRLRPEAARGLGHDAGGDRLLPGGRRRVRRPGGDPHRHAQRIGLRRGHDRRLQGPHHPRLPHRRRRRRPRPRHHQASPGCANVLPSSTNPTRPYTVNTHRRASRHADGVPSPRPAIPEDRRLRREPHPPGDDRRRGHPARPRRVLDDVVGQPGDGPGRRGDHPHLADRRQDEAAARPARRRRRATTTTRASSATSPNTRSTRRSPMASRRMIGSVEVGKLADLVLWSPAFFGVKPDLVLKGGIDRRGADGRPQRLDPDAAAGALPADVRRLRPAPIAPSCVTFVSPGGARRRAARRARPRRSELVAVATPAAASARSAWSTTTRRRTSRSIRRPTRCAPTASSSPASRPRSCRWRSAISCSESMRRAQPQIDSAGDWPRARERVDQVTLDYRRARTAAASRSRRDRRGVPARPAARARRCATATAWRSTTAASSRSVGRPEPLVEIAADEPANCCASPGISATGTCRADHRRQAAHPARPRDRGDARGLGAPVIARGAVRSGGGAYAQITPTDARSLHHGMNLASAARPRPCRIARAEHRERARALPPAGLALAGLSDRRLQLFARARMRRSRPAMSPTPRALRRLDRAVVLGSGAGFGRRACSGRTPIGRGEPDTDDARAARSRRAGRGVRAIEGAPLETAAQGAAFLDATRAAWPCAALDRLAAALARRRSAYPLAVGVAAAGHGMRARAGADAPICTRWPPTWSPPACGSFRSGRPTASASSRRWSPSVAATRASARWSRRSTTSAARRFAPTDRRACAHETADTRGACSAHEP